MKAAQLREPVPWHPMSTVGRLLPDIQSIQGFPVRRFANWRSVLVYRRSWRRCDVGVGLTAAVTMQATCLPLCDVRCNAVNPLAPGLEEPLGVKPT